MSCPSAVSRLMASGSSSSLPDASSTLSSDGPSFVIGMTRVRSSDLTFAARDELLFDAADDGVLLLPRRKRPRVFRRSRSVEPRHAPSGSDTANDDVQRRALLGRVSSLRRWATVSSAVSSGRMGGRLRSTSKSTDACVGDSVGSEPPAQSAQLVSCPPLGQALAAHEPVPDCGMLGPMYGASARNGASKGEAREQCAGTQTSPSYATPLLAACGSDSSNGGSASVDDEALLTGGTRARRACPHANAHAEVPSIRSAPAAPSIRSAPAPPSIRSAPTPPSIRSAPAPAVEPAQRFETPAPPATALEPKQRFETSQVTPTLIESFLCFDLSCMVCTGRARKVRRR